MQTQQEIWKDIEGHEGRYQISNIGRVKSLSRILNIGSTLTGVNTRKTVERILKTPCGNKGYLVVGLTTKCKHKVFTVHKLVAKAFVNNPYNKPHVNHMDKIRTNNHYTNLEWVTQHENNTHSRLNNPKFSSKHLGVTKRILKYGVKWEAVLRKNREYLYIGRFDTEQKAYEAINKKMNV